MPFNFVLSLEDIKPFDVVVARLYVVSDGMLHVPSAHKNLLWSPFEGFGTSPCVPSAVAVAPVMSEYVVSCEGIPKAVISLLETFTVLET